MKEYNNHPERYKDNVTYNGIHQRISRERGKAKKYACSTCGQNAKEWAHVHDTDELDINNYQPMCVKCHRLYDDIYRKGWETKRHNGLDGIKSKMSASQKRIAPMRREAAFRRERDEYGRFILCRLT